MKFFVRSGALLAAAILTPSSGHAGDETELRQIRQQIDGLLQRRVEDERRIQDLERRLAGAETDARRTAERAGQTQATATASRGPQGTIGANAFNPAIGVVLDGRFGAYQRDPDDYAVAGFPLAGEAGGGRGIVLGEAEVNASANIDDWFFGNLTVALGQDEDETEIELEEAYLQTSFLPHGLQVTAGKFFSGIGYLNAFHAHADDFADRPLAYSAFLANQLGDAGARLTWLAPTDFFLQFGAEAFRGSSFPAEGARHGVGAKAVFAKVGDDIGPEISWQAGLSYLWADADGFEIDEDLGAFRGSNDVGIAHLVVKWAPDGNPIERNLKLQAEAFMNDLDGRIEGTPVDRTSYGFYGQAIYQFMPQWRVGYRFDWLDAGGVGAAFAGSVLDDDGHDPTRHTVMVEYSHSEFSRLRLQYSHDRARPDENDNQILLQYTASFGAHSAHRY